MYYDGLLVGEEAVGENNVFLLLPVVGDARGDNVRGEVVSLLFFVLFGDLSLYLA
jgi:hypothetical protein